MCFQKDGVNVPFEVIHRHERFAQRVCQCLAVSDSNQQRPNEARAVRYTDGVQVREIQASLRKSFPDDWNDLAKVFARGQLRHDTAIFTMDINLRGYNARKDFAPVSDDGRGRFVTGRFDAENADAHPFMLAQRFRTNARGRPMHGPNSTVRNRLKIGLSSYTLKS